MEVPKTKRGMTRLHAFTPETALQHFSADFLEEGRCREWVLRQVHPSGPRCPACQAAIEEPQKLARFWNGDRLRCPSCGKNFTALSETFLAGTHMAFREMVLLTVLLATGLNNSEIAAVLKSNPETVRLWRQKFSRVEKLQALRVVTVSGISGAADLIAERLSAPGIILA